MDLVTGGTGIVGSHLLFELVSAGRRVRALYRKGSDRSIMERVFRHYSPNANKLLQHIEWVEGDLLDVAALAEAMTGVEHIYHAAAVVSFDPRKADEMYSANTQGTARVVDAALAPGPSTGSGRRRLCHVSSTAAIGWAPPGIERDETLPWVDDKRTSDYARSKYQAEMEVQRGIAEGLDAVIVNPCVILGPGVSGRSSMSLVERVHRGTRWYSSGSNAFVDARDVAACMVVLMERGESGERYLLVGENATYEKLFRELSIALGKPVPTSLASTWLLGLAWRLERIRSLVTRSSPLVTRATVQSSITLRSYSNKKVKALLGYNFRTLAESAANVSAFVSGAGR
ncbi:MAG: NAD-dependent epimerase/dehydratase family protein [Flavobacteriales bacterium]|nr:NAD-dependent epimerase/dehydratase family protein [Flavobacteriales bacterium]